MIIGQMLLGLFIFALIMAFICETIRKNEIKKDYKLKGRYKESLEQFTARNYNRI